MSSGGWLFARNSVVYLLGTLGSRLASLILLPLNTYYLSTSQYGEYDLAVVIASLILPVSTLTLSSAMYRFMLVEQDEARLTKINTNIWVMVALCTSVHVAMILVACRLLSYRFGFMLALLVVVQSFAAIAQPMLRGLRLNSAFAVSGVLMAVSQAVFNLVFLVFTDWKTEALLLSMVVANGIVTLYCVSVSRCWRFFDVRELSLHEISFQLKFTVPLIPAALVTWINTGFGRLLLNQTQGSDALGVLGAGTRLSGIASSLFGVLNFAMNDSVILDVSSRGGRNSEPSFFSRAFSLVAVLIVSSLLPLLPIMQIVFPFLIDTKFDEARSVVPLVLMAAAFGAVADLYLSVFLNAQLTKIILHSSILGAASNVAFAALLIPQFGVTGAGGAVLLSTFAVLGYRHYRCTRIVSVPLGWRSFGAVALVCVVATGYYVSPASSIGFFVFGVAGFVALNLRLLAAPLRLMKGWSDRG